MSLVQDCISAFLTVKVWLKIDPGPQSLNYFWKKNYESIFCSRKSCFYLCLGELLLLAIDQDGGAPVKDSFRSALHHKKISWIILVIRFMDGYLELIG